MQLMMVRPKIKTLCKLFAACALAALFVAGEGACSQVELERQASAMTGGDPAKGKEAISRYGCGTCHSKPFNPRFLPRISDPEGWKAPPAHQGPQP